MTNNDIFKKLRVALSLKDTDIVEILALVDFKISKSELSAIFRKEDHPNYQECGDQLLRNFLNGLIVKYRGPRENNPAIEKETTESQTVEVETTEKKIDGEKKSANKSTPKNWNENLNRKKW